MQTRKKYSQKMLPKISSKNNHNTRIHIRSHAQKFINISIYKKDYEIRNKLLENYSKIINPKGQANPQSGNPLTKFEQKEK